MADKGHTELPFRFEYDGTYRRKPRIYGADGRLVAECGNAEDDQERWEADAQFIVTAVNTYPAVEGLVKALEFISDHINDPERGPRDLYPAFGLDATQAKEVVASALSRFRSLQNGGAE
jgi:hypothetical protein